MRNGEEFNKNISGSHSESSLIECTHGLSLMMPEKCGIVVNWPCAHWGVLQLTEASSLGPDSPRMSPRNETVKQVDVKWLWRILQSSGRHEHDAENDETIHDTVLE